MIEIPKTNTLILDKRNPLQTVRVFRQEQYRYLDQETLYFYQGEFYSWNGSRYRVLDQQQIRTELYKFLDAAMVQEVGGTYIPFRPDQRQVNLVIDALRAQCNVPAEAAPPCWQSNDPHLPPAHEVLPCANGLLHLPTSMLSPATPAFFSMNVCSLTWKPNAPKPERWLKFLNELWRNDPESIRVLQQWFGYCLTSDTRQQKILLIVGPKRSGKGTIANVLTKLVGNDNVTGPTLNKFAAEFGLQSMIGRSLAIIPDARLGRRSDETVIVERLLSISGEDLLNIPRKYLQDWIGQLSTRVMMLTNELPQLHDSSGALSSRMLILVLSQSFFGREDIELRKTLLSELPGILQWAIDGWDSLQAAGEFAQPNASKDITQELQDLSSPIGAFLRERCEVAAQYSVNVDEVFASWKNWCGENGNEHPGTVQIFGRDLRTVIPGLSSSQRREKDGRRRIFRGVKLREVKTSLLPRGTPVSVTR